MAKRIITTIKLKECVTCGVLVGNTTLHKRTAHNTQFKEYRLAVKIEDDLLFREKEVETDDNLNSGKDAEVKYDE